MSGSSQVLASQNEGRIDRFMTGGDCKSPVLLLYADVECLILRNAK